MTSFRSLLVLLSISILCNTISARTVFVSSTVGSDQNDGLTESKPFHTISRAVSTNADTIYLFTDDIFYETVNIKDTYLSRYGSGKNPQICGLRRFDKNSWEKVSNNIWRADLASCCNDGYVVKGSGRSNNIGCFYEPDKDVLHGCRVQYYNELNNNWDYWQTEHFSSDMDFSEFDTVYMYLDRNPNELKLDCSVGAIGMIASNSTIDGVNVIGFGFGIVAGDKTIIRNSKVDLIGGMLLIGYKNFAPYGNGIEFNLSNTSKSDCLVENCLVSRTYDSGMTIQASKAVDMKPQNIAFRNNLLVNCCQGWEDYLLTPDSSICYVDCVFENNIVLNSGKSGFGYPESRVSRSCILGYNSKGNKGMVLRKNLFVGGNYYCSSKYDSAYMSNVWDNNRCYLEPGSYILSNPKGTEDVIRVSKSRKDNNKNIDRYRVLTGDKTTRFKVKSNRWIEKTIHKELKTFLKKNTKYYTSNES